MSPKPTRVEVKLPLPADVAGTIMKLIGTAYPTARMETAFQGMVFLIDDDARPVEVEEFTPDAREGDTQITELGGDTFGFSSETLAAAMLEVVEGALDGTPGAVNYIEQKLWSRATNKQYVMTFQRAEGKTPHELRTAADAEVAHLEQVLAKTRAALATYEAVPHHDENTMESTEESYDRGFAIGHNAALDAVSIALGAAEGARYKFEEHARGR